MLNIGSGDLSPLSQASLNMTSPGFFNQDTPEDTVQTKKSRNGIFKGRLNSLQPAIYTASDKSQQLSILDEESTSRLQKRKHSQPAPSNNGRSANGKSVKDYFSTHQRFNALF